MQRELVHLLALLKGIETTSHTAELTPSWPVRPGGGRLSSSQGLPKADQQSMHSECIHLLALLKHIDTTAHALAHTPSCPASLPDQRLGTPQAPNADQQSTGFEFVLLLAVVKHMDMTVHALALAHSCPASHRDGRLSSSRGANSRSAIDAKRMRPCARSPQAHRDNRARYGARTHLAGQPRRQEAGHTAGAPQADEQSVGFEFFQLLTLLKGIDTTAHALALAAGWLASL